jgi:peptide/nickel transport system permease protein
MRFRNLSLPARLSWLFLALVVIVAITGPLISNEKPYYCKLDGKTYFPLFSGISESTLSGLHPDHSPVNWYTTKFESIWYAPIPYSYYTIDLKAGSHVSPFDKQEKSLWLRHWLGTDLIGRDVMAGMIRGCRISILIGLGSMLIALLIGVPLGSLGAYWGNSDWRASLLQIISGIVLLFFLIYLWWLPFSVHIKLVLLIAIIVLGIIAIWISGKLKSKKISLPLDHFVMGLVSIIDSFPGLFIVLILLVVIPVKGWVVVMGAIALLRWPVMARYMRAEVYKIKESNYIKAVQVLNIPHLQILKDHIIPYAFRPVMISFIFGISSAILAESSLSFLGIGLPPEELNWGRLLSQARNHFDAWWLVLFPGAAIFFTLLSLYTIGNEMQKSIEHRA